MYAHFFLLVGDFFIIFCDDEEGVHGSEVDFCVEEVPVCGAEGVILVQADDDVVFYDGLGAKSAEHEGLFEGNVDD